MRYEARHSAFLSPDCLLMQTGSDQRLKTDERRKRWPNSFRAHGRPDQPIPFEFFFIAVGCSFLGYPVEMGGSLPGRDPNQSDLSF